jgi:hypothetical protein
MEREVLDVAEILNQSKNTVHNILKGNHMHPNHYTKVQRLLSEDYAPRLELQEYEENTSFLANVLLTDESYFCHKGTFNSHKNVYVIMSQYSHMVRRKSTI